MRVVPVPCLKDNYAYLVCDGSRAAVVDPSEAAPVLAAAAREGVTLEQLWCTHHHLDHVGGVEELVAALPGVVVVAHQSDSERKRIPCVTRAVADGDGVTLGGLQARVMHVPGHTTGAISLVVGGAVFTGDTLFGAGCGRLFEGTPEMMHASLTRLAGLPGATRVYSGHEYTVSNLRFAAAVEPGSSAVTARAEAAAAARAAGQPTVSTIADEQATNPFLRWGQPAVAAAARTAEPDVAAPGDAVALFAALRRWKDRF